MATKRDEYADLVPLQRRYAVLAADDPDRQRLRGQLKDLHVAMRSTLAELSQQLGRAPRPSEIADRLQIPVTRVIEGLQAGEAYRSSSLNEMLDSGDGTAMLGEFIGSLDAELAMIDDRQALRPLLAELAPRDRAILALRFFHHLTQNEIAEQVGISQMHVSRVLRQTLAFLQKGMAS